MLKMNNDSHNKTIWVVSLPQELLTHLLTNCTRNIEVSPLFYHFMNQPSTSHSFTLPAIIAGLTLSNKLFVKEMLRCKI